MIYSNIGFNFENFIYQILISTKGEPYKEKDIRKKFKNITAIDHILIYNNNILCFQEKWKESKPNIEDIHHFISCVEQLKINLKDIFLNYNYYGIYLSKKKLTYNAQISANNYNIINIYDETFEGIKKILIDYLYDHHNIYLYDKDNDILMR